MNYTLIAYGIYIPATIILTVYVANVLYKNGKVFLLNAFNGNEHLTDAINQMLRTGFYLINIGYALTVITIHKAIYDGEELIEVLGYKLGTITIILGIVHIINMLILNAWGKSNKTKNISNNEII